MGVKKYRSVEDMPGPAPRRPLDPENLRIAFGLMDLARHLSPLPYVPGVHSYRSYAEMIQERERREIAHVRSARAAREKPG